MDLSWWANRVADGLTSAGEAVGRFLDEMAGEELPERSGEGGDGAERAVTRADARANPRTQPAELVALALDDDTVALVSALVERPELFTEALAADEKPEAELELSQQQHLHAVGMLELCPQLSALRYSLCPRAMTEGQFWRIYFARLATEGVSLAEPLETAAAAESPQRAIEVVAKAYEARARGGGGGGGGDDDDDEEGSEAEGAYAEEKPSPPERGSGVRSAAAEGESEDGSPSLAADAASAPRIGSATPPAAAARRPSAERALRVLPLCVALPLLGTSSPPLSPVSPSPPPPPPPPPPPLTSSAAASLADSQPEPQPLVLFARTPSPSAELAAEQSTRADASLARVLAHLPFPEAPVRREREALAEEEEDGEEEGGDGVAAEEEHEGEDQVEEAEARGQGKKERREGQEQLSRRANAPSEAARHAGKAARESGDSGFVWVDAADARAAPRR